MHSPCGWRDSIDLLVIWLGRVEFAVHHYHAVPGPVGFPIAQRRPGICNRVGHLKCGEICNITKGLMIDIYQDNSVGMIRISMRAPATRKECVKVIANKRYIRDSQCVA